MFNNNRREKPGTKNKINLLDLLTDIAIMAAEELITTTTLTMEEAIEFIVSSLKNECKKSIK